VFVVIEEFIILKHKFFAIEENFSISQIQVFRRFMVVDNDFVKYERGTSGDEEKHILPSPIASTDFCVFENSCFLSSDICFSAFCF